jgi:hypothetical protein
MNYLYFLFIFILYFAALVMVWRALREILG